MGFRSEPSVFPPRLSGGQCVDAKQIGHISATATPTRVMSVLFFPNSPRLKWCLYPSVTRPSVAGEDSCPKSSSWAERKANLSILWTRKLCLFDFVKEVSQILPWVKFAYIRQSSE